MHVLCLRFHNKGYEVWMPDYPDYGKSTGERTEQKLYSLAYEDTENGCNKISRG